MAASPTIAAIKTAIANAVKLAMNPATPANVLTFHTKRRFWRDQQKFESLFKRSAPDLLPGKINGGMVYRASTQEIETEERWRFYEIHTFQIEMYLGAKDADAESDEAAFDAQIELIRDNIRLNRNIFGNMERTAPTCDVIVQESATAMNSDSTCWRAVLQLKAEAIETKTETP